MMSATIAVVSLSGAAATGLDGSTDELVAAGGFIKKFAFVSAPMWCAAVLLLSYDIKPAPLVPLPGLEPLAQANSTEVASKRAAWLEAELRIARTAVNEERRKVAALQADLTGQVGLIVAAVDGIPGQGVLATVAGVLGMLAIVGPSSFTRGFLAIVGSTIAALFVAGCASFYLNIARSPFWIDCLSNIVNSRGSFVENAFFLVFMCLGVARWVTGWECGIYETVDEVEMDDDGQIAVMQKPLLGGEQPPLLPPPGAPHAA